MPRLTLDAGSLRVGIDPDLGASITEFSILGPSNDRYPLMRRAPQSPCAVEQTACFLMTPWTNRVADASFSFQGTRHELRSNCADASAIHGVARDAPWRVTDRSPTTVTLVYDSRAHEMANSTFLFASTFRVELLPDRLELDLSVTNLGDEPMPAGCGLHPYFPRALMTNADDLVLRAPVAGRYPCEGCIPTDDAQPDEVSDRISLGGTIQNGLDDVFAGFEGRAELTWPASGIRLTMSCSEAMNHLVVYTPTTDGHPDSPALPWMCVEPTTMVNDGFNRLERGAHATGVRVLEPGASLCTQTVFHVERTGEKR